MAKRLSQIFLFALSFLLLSVVLLNPIGAATSGAQTVIEQKDFTTTDKEPKYTGFSTVISKGNDQYELTDIQYKNKGTVGGSGRTESRTTTRTENGLSSKSYAVGQTHTINENGKSYEARIINVSYETNTEGNRWGEVSGSKDYGLQTEKPDVPNTMALDYYDSGTGQTLTINAHLTSLEQTSSQWQDYSYIDIEVSNYTDSKYMFDGNVITNNGSTVLPESYYSTLLSLAGMNDGKHKISSIYWLGDAYKSGSVRNRQARADIQAYSASYTAHYYERFSLDGLTTYNATIEYEYNVPIESDQTLYKYTATATYTLIQKATERISEANSEAKKATADEARKKIEQETVVKTITTLSLLLILCLGFVILIMFLLTKFKLRKKDFVRIRNKKNKR